MTDSEKLDFLIAKSLETDKKFEEINQKLEKLDKMEKDITEIKLTLENEIRTNIKRVAEGHLDLARQFEKTVKLDNEKEMLAIRVSILETEMRRMQQQLNQMAG